MESRQGLTAILLCCSLCLPAPAAAAQQPADSSQPPAKVKSRPDYLPGRLRGDQRILQALNRFTFGPRPGDLDAVRKMGLDKWFDQQLHPASIDESDLNARLAEFPAMQWDMQDLFYRLPSNPMIRQAIDGKVQVPPDGLLHAIYENQIDRVQAKRAAKAQATASTASPQEMNQAGMNSAATMQAPEMDAMPPSAAAAANPTTPAEPERDEAAILQILALPANQRVLRLASMEPADFENFIKSLRPAERQGLTADLGPDLKEAVRALENPEQTVVQELFAERLVRDIYSNAQLQEVMTDFWLNHFNVYLHKNEQMPYYLVSYERDVIRPLALGKFEDLLEAVAHSPAMLLYLDNAESLGPDSPAAERARINAARNPNRKAAARQGLNENYARELMELHTLGVNGGYTQADVVQVARVLTGWTVERPQFGGDFLYAPQRHEPGTKKVLNTKIKENGEMEGRELLHMLAMRPATAQFISRKLAIRFVSDDPPQTLVDRMAQTYLASGGDIPSVLKTLFRSPEFWATSDYRAKVKTPLEFVVSAARASDANVENYQPLVNALRQMGMPLYGCMPPTGYKWDEADWVSTGALVDRMNFALSLASNRLPGITVEWAPELDLSALDSEGPSLQVVPTPETEETRLEPMLIPGGVSSATRSAALEQFEAQSQQNEGMIAQTANRKPKRAPAADQYEREDQVLAGLLLGSPEFQRR